jgi:ferredoxin-NADP reductase
MKYILKKVDDFLNTQTMYRLVFQSLTILACVAIVFGFFGWIAYSGFSLIASLIVILGACYISNYIFARIVSAPRNIESVFISSLILFFILSPSTSVSGYLMLALAGIIAMASKYILVVRMKHVFNPAAISLVILGLFGSGLAVWWVGTPSLLLFVSIIGFLVIRKLKKAHLFFSFAITAIICILGFAFWNGATLSSTFIQIFTSWPLLFFGTIMLTEPFSTPPTLRQQTIYGIIVGILFGSQFSFGPVYSTPELALIIGNLYTFAVSPKYFSKLTLRSRKEIASGIYEFIFSSSRKMNNIPGQYVEWTLPHTEVDTRGVRRYFTVASSPTEEDVKIGVRMMPDKGSTFKKNLLNMNVGDTITATILSGDFVLPKDPQKKLVFIAGGIGVTPFRSMIQYMIDKGERRPVTMFYSNKTVTDIAYKEIFDRAETQLEIKTLYVVNDPNADISSLPEALRIVDQKTIKQHIPDFMERTFYISGPSGMVSMYEKILVDMGVPKKNIKTDFFPGY